MFDNLFSGLFSTSLSVFTQLLENLLPHAPFFFALIIVGMVIGMIRSFIDTKIGSIITLALIAIFFVNQGII